MAKKKEKVEAYTRILSQRTADFSREGLQVEDAQVIASCLLNCNSTHNLKELYLSGNNIQDDGFIAICSSFKYARLTEMRVAKNGITAKGIPQLCKILANPSCVIEKLNFNSNQIGDAGITALCKTLCSQECKVDLIELDVAENGITDNGVGYLCNLIASRSCSISELSLQGNKIGDEGVKSLCSALAHNTSIIKIHLGGCEITDEGARCLLQLLNNSNNTIRRVTFPFNQLKDATLERRIEEAANSSNRIITSRPPYVEYPNNIRNSNNNLSGSGNNNNLSSSNNKNNVSGGGGGQSNSNSNSGNNNLLNNSSNSEILQIVRLMESEIFALKQSLSTQTEKIEAFDSRIKSLQSITAFQSRVINGIKGNHKIRSDIIKEHINTFNHLRVIKNIANGCEGMVFKCEALCEQSIAEILSAYDLSQFAMKILYNMGNDTFKLPRNEFEILNDLQNKVQHHPNIIPILHHFIDIPSDNIFNSFTEILQELGTHQNGIRRSCTAILTPFYPYDLNRFLRKFGSRLKLIDRLLLCLQLANALKFLTQNYVIHRDLKLDNILVNTTSHYYHQNAVNNNNNNNNNNINNNNSNINVDEDEEIASACIIVADFGLAIKVNENYEVSLIPNSESLGGNPNHLAPEIRYSAIPSSQYISYRKQPSWEMGLLAYEILFGQYPDGFVPKTDPDQFFTDNHFRELYHLLYSGNDDYNSISGEHIAVLLKPLLRTDPLVRMNIWDAHRSFLAFIQTHFPNHPISSSLSL